ncbi:endo alpha-1,4 polygalactosaminidase [Sphingobium sp. JS3065]|uniref:endo alpha-1,4 polygalactosaminidase n=1 Tax=Sphingobium sp. JS3065 TaxID=2970925 RepID=UPI0022656216|nr:endo alpha-1,4 polygalactosaminidase [Sphingobium sp. JS3065]UZW56244.1 endo alpha-1,4 polygalactosaminidase [Sphingobium sp. JS3065]
MLVHRTRKNLSRTSAVAIAALILAACGGSGGSGNGNSGSPAPTPAPSPSPSPTPSPSPAPAPTPLSSWDWILQSQGLPATPPAVAYLNVDGFDTSAAYVALAESRGSRTICYLDIGSAENNRPDYSRLTAISGLLGNSYPGFAGERYIDIRRYPEFIEIMDDRLRMCRDKGFDYVEFDVMDAFEDGAATTGFNLTEQDMIDYVTALSIRARGYGLKPVQKNASGSSAKLVPLFDAVLFEGCVLGNFCSDDAPYVAAGKPAFNAEYPEEWPAGTFDRARTCNVSATARISTIITVVNLDRPAPDRCTP